MKPLAAILTDAERAGLDRDGYVVLDDVLDAAEVAVMRASAETQIAAARRDPTRKHGGTDHLDLAHDDMRAFEAVSRSPRILAAVAHVLGAEFRLADLGFRGPRPGYGAQALHTDDVPLAPGDAYRAATAIVPLVDFTPVNGATRVVPGSHREPPADVPAEPGRPHPRERAVTARAGSAIVFNGHLWHSGTRNDSNARRDALQIVFRRGPRLFPFTPLQR
jgi:ectoine hydroxylase-related dioxygenase (phytanoyl-CoA dioxygenase family)